MRPVHTMAAFLLSTLLACGGTPDVGTGVEELDGSADAGPATVEIGIKCVGHVNGQLAPVPCLGNGDAGAGDAGVLDGGRD